jgi:hypothetical protein
MCPYNDTEIEYPSPTPSDKISGRLGSRTLATPADADRSLSAISQSARAPSVAPHEIRGPGALRAPHASTISWALLRNAARQPLARLDHIAAKLNTALVIVAVVLAYADLAVYLGFKAMALDLDWATILQAYAIVPNGMI